MVGVANIYDSATPFTQARLDQVKANGGVGVCRYVKRYLPNGYNLTAAERRLILGNGLGLKYNAEQNAGDLLTQTEQWWAEYGQYCRAYLIGIGAELGQGLSVAASADTGVASTQIERAIQNVSAFNRGLGAGIGVDLYAQVSVIDEFVKRGIRPGGLHWLPAAIGWTGWRDGTGNWDWRRYLAYPHAAIVQLNGTPVAGTDLNTVVGDLALFGMEWPAGHSPQGGGVPLEEEDDMDQATFNERMENYLVGGTRDGSNRIANAVWGTPNLIAADSPNWGDPHGLGPAPMGQWLFDARLAAGLAQAAVDPVAVAAAVVAAIGDHPAGASLTADELAAAVELGMKNVLTKGTEPRAE